MRKEDKSIAIEKIAQTLKEYPNFYLVETAGLNAEKTSQLRRACAKAEVKLMLSRTPSSTRLSSSSTVITLNCIPRSPVRLH